MSTAKATLVCTRCRSDQFERPENPQDFDIITCSGCGSQFSWGDAKKAAGEQFKAQIQKGLNDAIKNAGFKK